MDSGRGGEEVDVTADHLLMRQVREGDLGQLGTLFDRYSRVLFNFFFRMTGNSHVSEDLVQDVFFRILKYRHTYRDQSKFSTWMYQIARNACLDDRRKKRFEVEWTDEACDQPSGGAPPGEDLERSEEVRLLRGALSRLAPDKREVLVLSRYQNLKYEQIAEVLDCDAGAVKVRVYRALRELRYEYLKLRGERASCDARR